MHDSEAKSSRQVVSTGNRNRKGKAGRQKVHKDRQKGHNKSGRQEQDDWTAKAESHNRRSGRERSR